MKSYRRRALLCVLAALTAVAAAATMSPAAPSSTARFVNFAHPSDTRSAAEPTLGVNPKTNAVLYLASTTTYRVSDFKPATRESTWTRGSAVTTSVTTLDPILDTDVVSGRTYVSQLTLACSLMAYSDDDGKTWTDVPNGCAPGSAFDHQSVGTGAFVQGGPLRPATTYDRAVYYCSQALFATNCGTSIDGGRSFLPAVNAWNASSGCLASHGHIKSAPDGTVYLPPAECDRGVGVAVSEDNGVTWRMQQLDGTRINGDSMDPSVGLDAAGTAYLAWGSAEGEDTVPVVSVGRNRGRQWTQPKSIAPGMGIKNVRMPAVVAGDNGRAAVAFLGTTTGGNSEVNSFDGVWRLYVAFTYDGGVSWRTVLATPESPVQVGRVCSHGVSCESGTRNLLDFMDAVIDNQGRVLVSFADGCLEKTCPSTDRHRRPTISRQQSGKGLYAKYDGKLR